MRMWISVVHGAKVKVLKRYRPSPLWPRFEASLLVEAGTCCRIMLKRRSGKEMFYSLPAGAAVRITGAGERGLNVDADGWSLMIHFVDRRVRSRWIHCLHNVGMELSWVVKKKKNPLQRESWDTFRSIFHRLKRSHSLSTVHHDSSCSKDDGVKVGSHQLAQVSSLKWTRAFCEHSLVSKIEGSTEKKHIVSVKNRESMSRVACLAVLLLFAQVLLEMMRRMSRRICSNSFTPSPSSFPSRPLYPKYNSGDCAICLCALEKHHEQIALSCGHCYHRSCGIAWRVFDCRCPVCRRQTNQHITNLQMLN